MLLLSVLLAAAGAQPLSLMECLVRRPLEDVEGNGLSTDILRLRQLSAPQTCVPLLCSDDILTVHTAGGVTYASVNVDERTPEGAQCLKDVAASRDSYRKSNFPVTFYKAGDLQPHSRSGAPRPAVTHLTMYSGPQARSASGGFVPQYARLRLARDLVVSVLSSCVGDPAKMELINKLGATWLGEMDSCMRLICHTNMEELALGYYNYLLYEHDKMEGEQCFKALQTNDIGTVVNTPLTQVRVVSAEGDTCTGTKIMVLNPTYSGTSMKLQRFLFYQAYKIHSFDCPELAETCLKQKLTQLAPDSETGAPPAKSEFSYQCANLLCDSRVGLTPSAFKKNTYKVSVDTEKMKPLNNVCVKSLSREKAARGADGAMTVPVQSLGISLQFSLL